MNQKSSTAPPTSEKIIVIKSNKFSPENNMEIDKLLFENNFETLFKKYNLISDTLDIGNQNLNKSINIKCIRNFEKSLILRFYQWNPSGISLGKFQQNVPIFFSKDIPVVKRLTGGRAVLHDRELTYSIVFNRDSDFYNPSVSMTYLKISGFIVRALKNLGFNVMLSPGAHNPQNKKNRNQTKGHHNFCYSSTSVWEITGPDNKKLVGSAQVRSKTRILQHGSIPLSIDHDLMEKFADWCSSPGSSSMMTSLDQIFHLQNQNNCEKNSPQKTSFLTIEKAITDVFAGHFKNIEYYQLKEKK